MLDSDDDDVELFDEEELIQNEDSEDEEYTDIEYLETKDIETNNSQLFKPLRIWFIRNKISREVANELLQILREDASCALTQDVRKNTIETSVKCRKTNCCCSRGWSNVVPWCCNMPSTLLSVSS